MIFADSRHAITRVPIAEQMCHHVQLCPSPFMGNNSDVAEGLFTYGCVAEDK